MLTTAGPYFCTMVLKSGSITPGPTAVGAAADDRRDQRLADETRQIHGRLLRHFEARKAATIGKLPYGSLKGGEQQGRGTPAPVPATHRAHRSSLRAEAAVGPRFGQQPRRETAEVTRDHVLVLVREIRRKGHHHRILTAAFLILLERAHQVVLVLACE